MGIILIIFVVDKIRCYIVKFKQFQEPNSEEDIIEFVKQYGVTFDMFEKIDVNGNNTIPLFKVLNFYIKGDGVGMDNQIIARKQLILIVYSFIIYT